MARRKRKQPLNTSARDLVGYNTDGFYRLYLQYSNLAVNRYKWSNLPKGITSRIIEKGIYERGQVFFVRDETLGFLCLPCSSIGVVNVYGDPIKIYVEGNGMLNKQYNIGEGVRILDNNYIQPLRHQVMYYAEKLDDLQFSIARNIRQQNNPYILSCTKDTELSIKNLFKKIEDREEAIFYDATLTKGEGIGVQSTDISRPYVVDKYRAEHHELEKELLTLLGFNCVINKESGMNTTELNSNNILIDMYIEQGLQLRQEACDEINAKFGLDITVESVPREMSKIFETPVNTEGGDE